MFMHITVINLFDHNVGMTCAKVRIRCSYILLVLIYLITMSVWHVPKLDLDVHSYHCYYRSGPVNSKSFVGKVFLQIKWIFGLAIHL